MTEIDLLKLKIKEIEEDKKDLLQRLRYYKERSNHKNDIRLINKTISFLITLQGCNNDKIKGNSNAILKEWKQKRINLQIIKKQDYVGKN